MKRHAGFTLIELLVTIAIVGIIAAIALPMFGEQMAKSRRSEAISTLADLQLRQERSPAAPPSTPRRKTTISPSRPRVGPTSC